ncbi:apolipoprotein D-like [Anastrepha obliqua]|uniref:apolipoprotein D-like n=1 Tax=Anastrepha obliqua TaxID=95512 RepID=UPI00240A7435|nr:apolipoprotein D-like [Anastrepha obliqua]
MQKTILAIIALALFGFANAQVEFDGACPTNVRVQSNFNVSAYMGIWYEYSKYPVYFEANRRCIQGQLTLREDGEVDVVNSGINTITNKPSSTAGSAVVVENAKLKVTFPQSTPSNVTSNYWVLSTDYDNYSVVYFCQPSDANSHSTIVWILTRTRAPCAEVISKAESVLTENGVSLSELVVTDQSNC